MHVKQRLVVRTLITFYTRYPPLYQRKNLCLQIAGGWSKPDAVGDLALCMSQLNLSGRAYHRILKPARTIADLAESEEIQSVHLLALTVCFAKALHAARSSQVDDGIKWCLETPGRG